MTVTPAMRARCRQMQRPNAEIYKSRPGSFMMFNTGMDNGLTWTLVRKMEDAGLIQWVSRPTDHYPQRIVAVLTEAGRAAAEQR